LNTPIKIPPKVRTDSHVFCKYVTSFVDKFSSGENTHQLRQLIAGSCAYFLCLRGAKWHDSLENLIYFIRDPSDKHMTSLKHHDFSLSVVTDLELFPNLQWSDVTPDNITVSKRKHDPEISQQREVACICSKLLKKELP
jgi:hypothetical protein